MPPYTSVELLCALLTQWLLTVPLGQVLGDRLQLSPSVLFPAAARVTGLGYSTTPAADKVQCILQCVTDSSCALCGFDITQGTCFLYRYGTTPMDPPVATNASLQFYVYQGRSLPGDCKDVQRTGSTSSGTYPILAGGKMLAVVSCDQDTDGGGWTVFQRRTNGLLDFSRVWSEYKAGFGDPRLDHWAGNELLHLLGPPPSGAVAHRLRVELLAWDGGKTYAEYDDFGVAAEGDFYRMNGGMEYVPGSTAANKLRVHAGVQFSTVDADHDHAFTTNCARSYGGGWWFVSCLDVNLNGRYNATGFAQGLVWGNYWYSYKATAMMVRPK